MTEKTRTRCCVVPGKQVEKENFINTQHMLSGLETHNYIVDHSRETTYIKGKLLGKVRKWCLSVKILDTATCIEYEVCP